MHYVMADLHGETGRWQGMLREISFSDRDTIYILGDVVDRGGIGGVDILLDIMDRPNVVMLLGNHEAMCLKATDHPEDGRAVSHWLRNGGAATQNGLSRLDPAKRAAVLDFLRKLPDHLEVAAGGQRYYLVHGFPADSTYDRVWARPGAQAVSPFSDGSIVVAGHTPVCELFGDDRAALDRYLDSLSDGHFRIFHGRGYIDVDCACGYPMIPQRRLACLRLEDLREFYT